MGFVGIVARVPDGPWGRVLEWATGLVTAWLVLLAAMRISQRATDYSLPPVPALLWKTAVAVAVPCAVSAGVDLGNPILSPLVAMVVFGGLMAKLFDLDLLQLLIIVIATWWVRLAVLLLLF
jgi:hypothetical protein